VIDAHNRPEVKGYWLPSRFRFFPQPIFYERKNNAMITKELLWAIRNELPMKLTIGRLGNFGPIAKQSDGYFRFQCPNCKELRATVNPSNNLAHCFTCEKNYNNIDLMMIQGYDFLPAFGILEKWLLQYRRDIGSRTHSEQTASESSASQLSAAK
jgi:hypothetical protein